MNKWYVITGGPSSGKTTVIRELEKKGYSVVDEAARLFIEQELNKGKTLEEIRKDELQFQKDILQLKQKIERGLSKDQTIFFDRGIPDTYAYLQLYNFFITPQLRKDMQLCSYKKIFLMQQLEYQKDYARIENIEQVKKLQRLLLSAYIDLGYTVITVPIMSIDDRVNYIIKNM